MYKILSGELYFLKNFISAEEEVTLWIENLYGSIYFFKYLMSTKKYRKLPA